MFSSILLFFITSEITEPRASFLHRIEGKYRTYLTNSSQYILNKFIPSLKFEKSTADMIGNDLSEIGYEKTWFSHFPV